MLSTEGWTSDVGDEPEGATRQCTAQEQEEKKGWIELFGTQPPARASVRTCALAVDETESGRSLASTTLKRTVGRGPCTIQPHALHRRRARKA